MFYTRPSGERDVNLAIMAEIDRQFLDAPFYGARRMTWRLRAKGWPVNVKRVRRFAGLRHAAGMTFRLTVQDGPDADPSAAESQRAGAGAQDPSPSAARPRDRSAQSGPPLAESCAFVCRSRGAAI
jgi:hypothetical protein